MRTSITTISEGHYSRYSPPLPHFCLRILPVPGQGPSMRRVYYQTSRRQWSDSLWRLALFCELRPHCAQHKHQIFSRCGVRRSTGCAAIIGHYGTACAHPLVLCFCLRILPVPGQGPSMKLQRELGHWEHNLVAVTEGPNPKIFKGKVEVRGLTAGFFPFS